MNLRFYQFLFSRVKKLQLFFTVPFLLVFSIDSQSQSRLYLHNLSFDRLLTKYDERISDDTNHLRANNDFLTPSVETFGSNIFVFMLNKYAIGNPSWTKISLKTLKYNLSHGFVWDSDGFEMNELFHPYSGALSFTAARSSGLSFWNSVIFPFAGSLMWELAMEAELPSINDLINTPSSGIVTGEISFRISSLFLNDNTTGSERILRETAAGLLSPIHGLNRLLSGKSWRIGQSPIPQDYSVSLSGGMLGLFVDGNIFQKHPHGFLNFNMNYGNPFSSSTSHEPFDYFKLNIGLGFSTHNTIIDIYGSGLLWGRKVKIFQHDKSLFGIFKNFDFLNTATYRIGATSVGTGLITKNSFSNKTSLASSISTSAVLLGGIDSPYAQFMHRDYNYGPGLDQKIEFAFLHNDFGKVYIAYDVTWIYVISGAKGNEVVGIAMFGVQMQINQSLSWAIEYLNYRHVGTYFEYPTLHRTNFAIRTYFITTF